MSRRPGPAIALAAALALGGCGGGLYLNFGSAFGDDNPDVSLAASATSARPGQSVHLVAAASDDFGIDSVAFYRADAQGETRLGADASAPYEWDAQVPLDASGTVEFFAVAEDGGGHRTRSAAVSVSVSP
jgi:hypothetical protein